MKKPLGKIIFDNFEEIVASVLFVVTLSLVIVNVIMRYVFRTGIPWAEEAATSCFVWTAFIGSAACYKQRAHVGVDILVNKMPQSVQNTIRVLTDAFLAFLNGYMFYLSIIYVNRSYRKPTPILGVSSAWISVSLSIALLDMAIWSVIFVVRDIINIKTFGKAQITGEEEKI